MVMVRAVVLAVKSRKRCLNKAIVFCHTSGECTQLLNRNAINEFIKLADIPYFKDQLATKGRPGNCLPTKFKNMLVCTYPKTTQQQDTILLQPEHIS